MYFLNELHEKNYNHLTNMVFPQAKKDSEYNPMAYLLALPDIYKRCINDPMLHEFPFLWTVEYKDTSYTGEDEDGEYKVNDFDIKKDGAGKEIESENYATLSSGYKKMVDLAANLFNSSNDDFNLTDAFGTWDNNMIKVYFQAVLLRLEGRRGIEGLDLKIH
ncbi:MAG: hypothetical protein Q8934_09050 [Bacillota bacterium]|nr:hypothetical protein [Bacillota bacterium]